MTATRSLGVRTLFLLCGAACSEDLLACGTGTVRVGSECIAVDAPPTPDAPAVDAPVVQCGAGTFEENGRCVAIDASTACGPGTHLVGIECVPDGTYYEVRVPDDQIPADGVSKTPVLALGDPRGGPVPSGVVWVEPAGSGTLRNWVLPLEPGGVVTYLTPCDDALTPSCLGPFHIRMALTTAPTIPVASSRTLYAVPQQGVGSRAPCLGGGNRLFLDGSGWVYDGTQLITDGRFVMNYVGAFTLHLFLDPSDRSQGVGWEVWVSTERLAQPLLEQVYPYAER